MRPRVLALLLTCALVLALSAPSSARAPLTLGTKGDAFTVGGSPKFLLLVSYFDAMDAAHLDDDLAWLRTRVDGVRVFVNWWDFDEQRTCATRFSDRTLMRVGAAGRVQIRPDRLDRLKGVLRKVRAAGMIADVTFSYEAVEGLSKLRGDAEGLVCGSSSSLQNQVRLDEYARGVSETARALAAPEFDHVFFDLQNELDGGWTRLTADEVTTLAERVRAVDPHRLLSASTFAPDPDRQVRLITKARLDIMNYHDWPRSRGWDSKAGDTVRRFKSALATAGLTVPIYDGEPPRSTYGGSSAVFHQALEGVRQAGAAAWTFHTRAGFRLDRARFVEGLDKPSKDFLDSLRR